MCGIAGIVEFGGEAPDIGVLRAMVRSLEHRGPDAQGTWSQGPVGLGHARLSIIDLATGDQPMRSADGSLCITYNGEVFNYKELRADLIERGHEFRTTSDTEVVLRLFEEKGEDCVRDLNGQWAFAIWDSRRQSLFLSRDRIGIRPLYYAVAGSRLVFASEVKSLFRHPAVERGLDLTALDDYFTTWCAIDERSVFRGVRELRPGHSARVVEGRLETWPYWQLSYGCQRRDAGEQEIVDGLRDLLVDATRLRLRADVPVGAYLSGGLDSSATVAMIRNCTDTPLETFSVGFEDPEFDESAYQKAVVRHLRTEHHEVRCSYRDIAEAFPDVVWHAEAPLVRTAPAPLFLLSALVRRHRFKVVVTGEGADEMLGGYDVFKEAKIRRFWAAAPDSRLRPLLLKRLYPYMQNIQSQPEAYLRAFFHVGPDALGSPFFSHLPRWSLTSWIKRFYSKDTRMEVDRHDPTEVLARSLPADYVRWDPFEQAQYLEAAILLPGYILSSQGDRMAMAHAVEGRFPFLDHRVVAYAASIPPRLKMKALNEKYVLKRAVAHWLPEAVLRRPKQPYRAPDGVSLLGGGSRGERPAWVEEALSARRLRAAGIFDPIRVEKLVHKFESGRAIGVRDNMALVGIVSTQILWERFVEGAGSGER